VPTHDGEFGVWCTMSTAVIIGQFCLDCKFSPIYDHFFLTLIWLWENLCYSFSRRQCNSYCCKQLCPLFRECLV